MWAKGQSCLPFHPCIPCYPWFNLFIDAYSRLFVVESSLPIFLHPPLATVFGSPRIRVEKV